MTDLSNASPDLPQGFYEELYVYCSCQDSYRVAGRLREELQVSLPEIEKLPDFSIRECEEDEYGLAEELEPDADCRCDRIVAAS